MDIFYLLYLSLTLCNPMDCSLPGSSIHGILQARKLEWVAISFSRTLNSIQGLNLSLLHWQADSFPLVSPGNHLLDSVQFSHSVVSTFCNPMNHSMPGLPVYHQLPEFTQTHIHRVGDAIQPSHPLSSPSPPAPNPSQHQSLFQWVSSSHEVAKVLEFQLQHHLFQWTPRTDLL